MSYLPNNVHVSTRIGAYAYIILFYLEYIFLLPIIWRGALWPEVADSQRGTLAGGGIQFWYILALPIIPNPLQGGSTIRLPILPILPYRRPTSE